jgi:predicted lipoprotein with Yx(FWY)xxD motif
MPGRSKQRDDARRWPVAVLFTVALGAFAIAAVMAAAAVKNKHYMLNVVKNVMVSGHDDAVVANSHDLTLYYLSPETKSHPLCTAASGCFAFWPPDKVGTAHATLTKAPGIKGKLGTWSRDGFIQLTLGGHPLYFFASDHHKHDATGEAIKSFGGVWHVVALSAPAAAGTQPPSTSTTTTPTSTPAPTPTTTAPPAPYYPVG